MIRANKKDITVMTSRTSLTKSQLANRAPTFSSKSQIANRMPTFSAKSKIANRSPNFSV